jgi:hypothetical protein
MRTSHPKSTAAAQLALLASFRVAGYFLAVDASDDLVRAKLNCAWEFLTLATLMSTMR